MGMVMGLNANRLKSKFRMMPDRQTIAYEVISLPDTYASAVNVTDVEKRPLSIEKRSLPEIQFDVHNETFHAWKENLGSIIPKLSDRFTDEDGDVWYIVNPIDKELQGQRYRLMVTKGV